MALSLAEFMRKVSEIVIAHETEVANVRINAWKEELKTLPAELTAQEEKLAKLQALAEQASQTLRDAEEKGLDGIEDPFVTLKKWSEKHGAWKGWKGEIKDSRSLPPRAWVRRSRNLSSMEFSQYDWMYTFVKQGKKHVFREYRNDLRQELEKAQENANKEQRSYEFNKKRYECMKNRMKDFEEEIEEIRAAATPKTQEDLEDILKEAWENEAQRKEILNLLPSESYTFTEKKQLNPVLRVTPVLRFNAIRLADAVLTFETYS